MALRIPCSAALRRHDLVPGLMPDVPIILFIQHRDLSKSLLRNDGAFVDRIVSKSNAHELMDHLADLPERMIGDRAYDSDPLDQRILERYGVQLIAPHKFVRVAVATQDGRVLRRYRRRWKVERLFAWLHNFRRIVIRWEYYPENFLGMVQLACAIILLRHL